MQERLHTVQPLVCDTSNLMQRLIDTWASKSQNVVDETVCYWTKQLYACITAKGHHFKHTTQPRAASSPLRKTHCFASFPLQPFKSKQVYRRWYESHRSSKPKLH